MPGGGRSKGVRLTDAGRPVLARMNAITEQTRASFLQDADKDKLEVSMSLFDDLLAVPGDD